ncbi:MAG: hypothetical protein PVF27_04005, partial [Gemmatimonadales bacterium]
ATVLNGADVDIYLWDAGFNIVADAAGTSNPEHFQYTIPAGETVFLSSVMWSNPDATVTVQIHVDGLP